MAENGLTVQHDSVFDNPTDRQVEFKGIVDGEFYGFGVKYSVLEALTGVLPVSEPTAAFNACSDDVAKAGLIALARTNGDDLVIISENDLDQTASREPGPHAGPEPDGFFA
jgi:hypothetical protein